MNVHQCLQLALNDCTLSAQLSEIDWVSNDEAIQKLHIVLNWKADEAAKANWRAVFGREDTI